MRVPVARRSVRIRRAFLLVGRGSWRGLPARAAPSWARRGNAGQPARSLVAAHTPPTSGAAGSLMPGRRAFTAGGLASPAAAASADVARLADSTTIA
jgi:hypothetical protein